MLLVLISILLVASADATACRRYIGLSIDVSASISAKNSTAPTEEDAGPIRMKHAIKGALRDYLFRDKQACLTIYTFATEATRVSGYLGVATLEEQQTVLDTIDGLVFETAYPRYYTNWEAGINVVSAFPSVPQQSWLYVITDGVPTTRVTGCATEQPCDGLALNMQNAITASQRIVTEGTGIVGVGVGSGVSDEALSAISGPCAASGCIRNWNFFHIDAFSRLDALLGQSFGQRLALASDSTKVPITAEPTTTTTTETTTTTTEPETTTTTTTEPPTTTTTTTRKRPTHRPRPTTTTKKKILAHTRRPMVVRQRAEVAATEVHSDAWIAAIVVGSVAGACVLVAIAVACYMSREVEYPPIVKRAQEADAAAAAADAVERAIGHRVDVPMMMQASFSMPPATSSGPRLKSAVKKTK
jgi:hypothetical protein